MTGRAAERCPPGAALLQDDEAGHPSVALQEAACAVPARCLRGGPGGVCGVEARQGGARADGAAVEPRDLAGADEQRQRAELHIPQPDRDLCVAAGGGL